MYYYHFCSFWHKRPVWSAKPPRGQYSQSQETRQCRSSITSIESFRRQFLPSPSWFFLITPKVKLIKSSGKICAADRLCHFCPAHRIRCSTSEPHLRHQPLGYILYLSWCSLLLTSQRGGLLSFFFLYEQMCKPRLLSCGDLSNYSKWRCAAYTALPRTYRLEQHDVLPGGCHRISLSSGKWYNNTVSEDLRYEAQCSIFSSYSFHIAFHNVRGSHSHSSTFGQSIGTALPERLLGYR